MQTSIPQANCLVQLYLANSATYYILPVYSHVNDIHMYVLSILIHLFSQSEDVGELPEEETTLIQPSATGPEIPITGLPEPDRTLAVDLDKADWQLVS